MIRLEKTSSSRLATVLGAKKGGGIRRRKAIQDIISKTSERGKYNFSKIASGKNRKWKEQMKNNDAI